MIGATFPLLGTAAVVLLILPASALFAKACLTVLEGKVARGPLRNLDMRYVLLVGSSVLPLAWLFSAGLHQAETGLSAQSCLYDHDKTALCFEPAYFSLSLAIVALAVFLGRLPKPHSVPPDATGASNPLLQRVERIVIQEPSLAWLRDRIVVVADAEFTLCTYGWFAPRVYIGSQFANGLSDDMLASALGHEAAHVRARDPLRYLLLQFSLEVNPVGRILLDRHATGWLAAREAECDREAVLQGASPLPLASAIVRAARPTAREAVALGARNTAVLGFRIGMLMAFAERAPSRPKVTSPPALVVGGLLLAGTLVLPHLTGTSALDALHTGSEYAATFILR